MIADLERSLTACLSRWLPAGTAVRFDAPRPEWSDEAPAAPTVALFLYDVREDDSVAAGDMVMVRDEHGRGIGWQPPIRRYTASYLVSTWCPERRTGRGKGEALTESGLLGAVLAAVVTNGSVAPEDLTPALAEATAPVVLRCASSSTQADPLTVWSALRTPARPALDLQVVASFVPALITTLAPPARSIDMGLGSTAATPQEEPAHAPAAWEHATIRE